MLNQVVLIGRLTSDPVMKETKEGKNFCEGTISVRRSFKNQEGKYETDFIRFSAWEGLAINFSTYAEKGTLVAIKGRIQPFNYKAKNDEVITMNSIVAEKITYLWERR